MQPITFYPQEKKLLRQILQFAKARRRELYLVGGFLRDRILGREKDNPDIDFCLKPKAINFTRQLKNEIKAGFVVLDKERGACRLVKKIKDKTYTLDFTDFRGKDLAKDLWQRDFTINTLAMKLEGLGLIDNYNGLKDIKSKIIRIVRKDAFDDDPLRILRAFSLSAIFGFRIEEKTLKLIKLKKGKLAQVSGERIRDELFKILERPAAFIYLARLDKLGILKIIIPEVEQMRGVGQGPYHHLDIWQHSLETFRQLEMLIEEWKKKKEAQDYLNEVISSERKRSSLMKLAALLHDIGKPQARRRLGKKTIFHGHEKLGLGISEGIIKRLRLANDELDCLKKMILWHLRPGYLADSAKPSERAKFRYFRDAGQETVAILLLSLADQRSTRGPLTTKGSRIQHEKVVSSLIAEYFRKKKEKKLARLLGGDDLMKKFKLQPSPLIGKILRELEELQAIGKVRNKKEAEEAARKIIHG